MKRKTKTEFVRSMGNAPASEIVAKAKAQGMTLSPAYIYVIRSKDRVGGTKEARKPKTAKSPPTETQFLSIALDIGLRRANELLENARAAVG